MTAPGWLVEAARLAPRPTPWARMVRAPLAICLPLALAALTGRVELGLPAALGALSSSVVERGGPYLWRIKRVSTVAVVGGALGLTVGLLVNGRGWVAVATVVGLAGLSAAMSVAGNVGSVAGLQLLLYATLATGPLGLLHPWWLQVLLFLAGAAYGLGLSVLGWPFFGRTPEVRSVAEAYHALATLLRAIGTDRFDATRADLTAALERAYDDVRAGRIVLLGAERGHARLATLLNHLHLLSDAAVTLALEGVRPPERVSEAVEAVARAVRDETPLRLADVPAWHEDTPGAAAFRAEFATVAAILGGETPVTPHLQLPRVGRRQRLGAMVAELRGRFVRVYALRLMLCLGVAAVISEVLPLERSYWVMLTVAVVLKPDFGPVLARALQRGVGTVVGALVGAALLAVVPYGPWLLVPVAVLSFLLPYGMTRNYALFTLFLTPLVVVLIDLFTRAGWPLAGARLIDTAVGCAIVLLLGYAPWPSSWYAHIGPEFAAAMKVILGFLDRAFSADRAEAAALRRQAYRRVSDVRAAFQRALAEPEPVARHATAWYPAVVAMDDVLDAITATATAVRAGEPRPSAAAVRQLDAALAEIGQAVAAGRLPRRMPLPSDPSVQQVVDAVRAMQGVYCRHGGAPQPWAA